MNKLLSGALVLALFAGCAAAACGACSNACTITAHEQKTGITEEQPFSTVSCDGFGGSTTRRGSWYKVNGTGETFMAELCDENTDYDTVIAVFNECNAKCIAYDDDGCGAKRSSVTFATTVGKSYYIFVTGFANETGNYVLALTPVEQPTNFRCDRAVNVTEVPFAAYDDTTLAPTSIRRCEESNGTTATGLWYKLVSGHGSYVLAKTCNEGTVLDTVIDVYMGDCLSDGGASECIVWNDDSCGVKSEVTFFAVPTTTYYIFVGGYGTTTGRFLFEIEDYSPNANSRCTNPIDVNEIPFVYDGHTGNATESYSKCQNTNRRGQWFLYRGHGLYMDAFTCAFDNTKTTFDNVIDVYTECNDDGTTGDCLIYNDDYCLRNARVRFFARTNVEYWIYVNGYTASTSGGNYTLTIEPSVNDTNTQCWKAHHINELPYDYSQDTFSLPTSLSGCSSPRTEKSGRWYSYYHNSMSSAEIEVDTCNDATTVATHIEVYQSCDSTTCKQTETKCSDDKEFAVFTAAPYQTYYIFIYGDTEGYIHVEFELHEAVAHAKCTDAITVPSTPYESAGLTTNAAYVKSNCTGDFEQGQWFLVKGTGKKMAASTCSEATDFDTTIDLYGSCRENARCMATNNDYYNCGERSKISWQSFKNANYYIYVHGHSSSHGVYILQIYDEASPDNAVCTGALEIPSLPYTAQGITTYAHTSNGTCHENVASKGVWYWFTGTGYKVRISTCFDETEFDTMIDIYEGCANDMGHNCFTESDDSTCGTKADITFNAYKGTTYYVFVTSSVTSVESEGFFELVIQQVSPIYPTDSGSSGLSSGAKAGIAIGVIAGVGAAAGAGFFFWKKRTLRADYNVIS